MSRTLHPLAFAASALAATLVPTGDTPAQSPQPAACNLCNCASFAGSTTQPLIAPPPNSTTVHTLLPGENYRAITLVLNNVYTIRTCGYTTENTAIYVTNNLAVPTPLPDGCDDDGCSIIGGPSLVQFRAAVGATHRIYIRNGACGGTFSIPISFEVTRQDAFPAPANNCPCNATSLGTLPLPNACTNLVPGTTLFATATNSVNCGVGATSLGVVGANHPQTTCAALPPAHGYAVALGDVWFSVPVPASGRLALRTTENTICAGSMAFYTSADPCSATDTWTALPLLPYPCSNEGFTGPGSDPGAVLDLNPFLPIPNNTLYIRYWERSPPTNGENGSFTICAYEPVPLVNDAPCGAISLPVTSSCNPIEFNTEHIFRSPASIPTPSCGWPAATVPAPAGSDMWFQVTVPPSGSLSVTTTPGTLGDPAMAWYTAPSCGGPFVEIACNDNYSGLMPGINTQQTPVPGLPPPGGTFYVRIWNKLPYFGTFSICARENVPPPNDNPCGALPLPVSATCVIQQGTNENASTTTDPAADGTDIANNAACVGGGYTNDVWFYVDVPPDLMAPYGIEITHQMGGMTDGAMAVYRMSGGSCTTGNMVLTPRLICTGATTLTLNVPTIIPGERLYVRVWVQTGPDGTFGLCARRTDPVPCTGWFYDSGGPSGNYQNNESLVQTFCAGKPGDVVTLSFTQFNVENNWDFMYIYNGPDITAPLIGTYTGTNSPGAVTATIHAGNPNGCLTVRFTSDFIIVAAGWAAKITCGPAQPPGPPPVGICGTMVYDPGGPSANYTNNIGILGNPAFTVTYCPPNPGDVITLTFLQFAVESNWDALYIYSGPAVDPAWLINSGNPAPIGPCSVYGPGGFWGGGPGQVWSTHPSGCITLLFVTDQSVTQAGWAAQVTCGSPPPPPILPCNGCTVTTACGGLFTDSGGPSGNYPNFQNWTMTICPSTPGHVVTINFPFFNVEQSGANSCWDMLYIFSGTVPFAPGTMFNSGMTASFWPPWPNPYGNGGWCNTNPIGPFTSQSPDGCITLVFFSDNIIIRPGWLATVTCAPLLPNDNPCTPVGATPLPVLPTCTPQTFNNTTATNTASVSPPPCGGYNGRDVWFRFVAPPGGSVFINTFAGTLTDAAMALYSAPSCAGPFTLLDCDDDSGPGLMPALDYTCNPLVPGQTYWIRVWGFAGQTGTFQICLVRGSTGTTIHDCAGAFNFCTGTNYSNNQLTDGCTTDLNNTNQGCLTTGEHQGTWYSFVTTATGTLGFTITPIGSPVDYDWALWGPYTWVNGIPATANCTPLVTGPPIRCSYASHYNTNNSTGSPATGMGSFSAPAFANPVPAISDGVGLGAPLDGWTPGVNVNFGETYLLFIDNHHTSATGFNLTWNLSDPNVVNCILLPVELLNLRAEPRTSTVDLLWTTASENNSSHFIVERSTDGLNFTRIGQVQARGNSIVPTDYAFTDRSPALGMNYYRLQQVDLDGYNATSNTVTAEFKADLGMVVVPNPSRDRAELQLSGPQPGMVAVRITDSRGRVVAGLRTSGENTRIDLPVQDLDGGSYIVELLDDKGMTLGRARFVKQ